MNHTSASKPLSPVPFLAGMQRVFLLLCLLALGSQLAVSTAVDPRDLTAVEGGLLVGQADLSLAQPSVSLRFSLSAQPTTEPVDALGAALVLLTLAVLKPDRPCQRLSPGGYGFAVACFYPSQAPPAIS